MYKLRLIMRRAGVDSDGVCAEHTYKTIDVDVPETDNFITLGNDSNPDLPEIVGGEWLGRVTKLEVKE